jgi:uncharacterized protein YggU (UPF0235/DUF167 family)
MRIYVKVSPRSGRNEVRKISDAEYKVWVAAAPEKGKANEAVVELIAKFLNVSKSSVNIAGGRTSKTKIIDIN